MDCDMHARVRLNHEFPAILDMVGIGSVDVYNDIMTFCS